MEFHKCDFADERTKYKNGSGYCEHKGCFCNGNGNMFSEKLSLSEVEKVEKKDICQKSSIWGNYYIALTDEQIEAIKNGEVFALLHEEYNIFIGMG